MNVLSHALLASLVLAAPVLANDIVPGLPLQHINAAQGLLIDPSGVLTINSVTLTTNSLAASCPGLSPEGTQFGIATGFEARSGFVLSNGYVEDLDNDGPAQGTVGACVTATGVVGSPGSQCLGTDPLLAGLLGIPTEDAAVLTIDFDAVEAVQVDLSYNFLTFESPTDPSFFDAFGIVLDGVLLAGGKSNAGAPSGDPWMLSPAPLAEYQSVSPSTTHTIPGNQTGRRTFAVNVAPGNHSLSFHVVDSGPPAACGPGACDRVQSALFLGLHTFQGKKVDGVGSAGPYVPKIDQVGHPSATLGSGGNFPPDFGVTLSGAQPNVPLFFVQGNGVLSPVTIPLLAPRELLIGPLLFITPMVTNGSGGAIFPPSPPTFNTSIIGLRIHFQWFGLDSGGVWNTPGLRVDFGP